MQYKFHQDGDGGICLFQRFKYFIGWIFIGRFKHIGAAVDYVRGISSRL